MASAFRRRMSQLTLLALFAFIVALLSGLAAAAAAAANPVKFSDSSRNVHYGDHLFIVSSQRSDGGVTSELAIPPRRPYLRLTGSNNDLGDIFTLISASGASPGTTVRENDEVHVSFFKLERSAPEYCNWRKEGEMEFLLQRTFINRTKFKIIARPVPRISPPVYNYALVSCPGSYCSGLSRYPEDEETYIQLGEKGSLGDLFVQFKEAGPRISMSTDN